MHTYLMSIRRYFSGEETFKIEAENKAQALELGKKYVWQSPIYADGNYDRLSVKVLKKMKPQVNA